MPYNNTFEQTPFLADFSLGILNRTGAYYITKEIVENNQDLIEALYFWRLKMTAAPEGLTRRIMARLMMWEFQRLRGSKRFRIERPQEDRSRVIFFDPLFTLRTQLSAKDIVLCHDVGPITHSQYFDSEITSLYQDAYAKIRRSKPGMVFVSETSKREFIGLYGDDFRFLKVITLYPRPVDLGQNTTPVSNIRRPFLLMVGGLEERKNHTRVLQAYQASDGAKTHDFLICGPRGNSTAQVRQAVAETPGARFLGQVSDEQLAWLYKHADGFVLPSLLEGFGVPVIEALQWGLIPIVSQQSAQEEAIGGNGILVDPKSVNAIAAGINQLLNMPAAERQKILSAGQAHAASLSRERFNREWQLLLERDRAAPLETAKN